MERKGQRSAGDRVVLYTDGGCRGNPGLGAWAVLVIDGDERHEYSGVEPETTNNRMELTAAIEGLRRVDDSCLITVHTDSDYVRRGITEWLPNWIASGWRTSRRKPVLNRDLWERLHDLASKRSVEWKWVAAHSGHDENERCDAMVNEAMDEYLRGKG